MGNFFKLVLAALIIYIFMSFIFGKRFPFFIKKEWYFTGYQYKWSYDYVDKGGFDTENECVNFGNLWLEKQKSEEALFTCSFNCKPYSNAPGIEVCDKVCEYGEKGFIQCRY